MRKLIILLILLLPTLAYAQGGMGMGPGPGVKGYAAASLTCTAGSGDSAISSYTLSSTVAQFGGAQWKAQKFTLSAQTRITKYIVKLQDVATTDTNTVTVSLRSSLTGSDIIGSDVSLAETSIDNSTATDYTLTLAAPITVAAGDYYLVIRGAAEANSTTTTIKAVASGGLYWYSANSGSSWTELTTFNMYYYVYGCQ